MKEKKILVTKKLISKLVKQIWKYSKTKWVVAQEFKGTSGRE
jgi:hypothetical protein